MIQVITTQDRKAVVSEFFELFKTPWRFFEGARGAVLIVDGEDEHPSSCPLTISFWNRRCTSPKLPSDARAINVVGSVRVGARRIPLYNEYTTFPSAPNVLALEETSSQPIAWVRRTGDCTVVYFGFDLFAEVKTLLTDGQPVKCALSPTLDLHIQLIRDTIRSGGIGFTEIPPVPFGGKYLLCLTHDIDNPSMVAHGFDRTWLGFVQRALVDSTFAALLGKLSFRKLAENYLSALNWPFAFFGLAKDRWLDFAKYLEIDGVESTYFVVSIKGVPGSSLDRRGTAPSIRRVAYTLNDIHAPLGLLKSAGCEIALHGVNAWVDRDSALFEQEQAKLPRYHGERGVRMHWLYFSNDSHKVLESSGFTYDSTAGFNATVGYKNGTSQVFRPIASDRLLELPLVVMDTALFLRSNLDVGEKQAEELIASIIDHTCEAGGALVVNWHDRSLFAERHWDHTYIRLVATARDRGGVPLSAAKTVAWFRGRRSIEFLTPVSMGESTCRSVFPPTEDTDLPSFTLRQYAAGSGLFQSPPSLGSPANYTDVELKWND